MRVFDINIIWTSCLTTGKISSGKGHLTDDWLFFSEFPKIR